MIKFFRKIRQNLITEGKTVNPALPAGRYLKYAIGEILLVVIGILIALQVNNWNEARKNKSKERNYLQSLIQDLKNDSISYINGWANRYQAKMDGLNMAKDNFFGDYIPKDTVAFINSIGKGGIGSSIGGVRINDNTFGDLISTGNLKLIENKNIRDYISGYYSNKEFIRGYLDNQKTQYARRINSFKPYIPSKPNEYDPRVLKLFFKSIKKPDFIEPINQEITYGDALNRSYNNLYQASLALRDSITNYLKKTDD